MPHQKPPDREDLVHVFYIPYLRPLGNLVIVFAQAEATWLELASELTGLTGKEAQHFLQMPAADAKQRLMPLAQTRGIEGFDLDELSAAIENYFHDRERRNRLMHDEWYIDLLRAAPLPRTRGLPRKGADIVWGDSTPDDVWKLAERFRDHRSLFSARLHFMRKGAPKSG
jgi:hypothetical protein